MDSRAPAAQRYGTSASHGRGSPASATERRDGHRHDRGTGSEAVVDRITDGKALG